MNTIHLCTASLFAVGIALSASFLPLYLAGTFSIWGLMAPSVLPFLAGLLFLAMKRRAKIENDPQITGAENVESLRARQQRSIEEFSQMY